MREILKSTEQNGEAFEPVLGLSLVLLVGAVASKTYRMQVRHKDINTWVDTDVSFTDNGIQLTYTSSEFLYRIVGEDTDSIGARAFISAFGL